MVCDRERLVELVAGALAPGDRSALEAHLAGCGACRVEAEALRGLRAGLLSCEAPLDLEGQSRLPALVWERIERVRSGARRMSSRQSVRRGAKPSLAFWGSLAAAAGLLLVAGAWFSSESRQWRASFRLSAFEGEVVVERDGASRPVTAGQVFRAGDAVRTGESARAELASPEGTRINLNERTGVSVSPRSRARGLTLEAGDIYVQAARQRPGQNLTFNPGQYDEAAVTGTAFEVSKSGRDTVLRVAEGRVEFGTGQPVSVGALQAASVRPGGEPGAPEPVALAEIGCWCEAAPSGVIYEDNFAEALLAPFWQAYGSSTGAFIDDHRLILRAGPADLRAGTTPAPACIELVSKPVRLGPKPVEFTITRDKADGPFIFLPLEGHPVLSADLVAGDGQPACHLIWRTTRESDGIVRGIFEAGLGREPLRNILGMPAVSRIIVDASGRMAVVKGENTVQLVGSAGRKLNAVSLRLSLSNAGGKDVQVRWTQFTVRRLEQWPIWVQWTGETAKPPG